MENEFLKRFEQSVLSYRKGIEVAERYLGSKHAIAITLKNSLAAAKKIATSTQSKTGRGGSRSASGPGTAATNKSSGKKTGTFIYIPFFPLFQTIIFLFRFLFFSSGTFLKTLNSEV